jgi:anti-sigma factor RsiW
MSTSTHPFTPVEIMVFVDGELSADRAQSIAAHLETCSECQEVAASLRGTSHTLSSWTAGTVPTHLEQGVLNQSHATPNVSEEGLISKLRKSSRLSPGLAFAAAAFVFVLALIGLSAPQYKRSTSAKREMVDYFDKPKAPENRGSAGKLEPIVPAAAPMGQAGVRHGDVTASVDFAQVDEAKSAVPRPPTAGFAQISGVRPVGPMIARTVALSVVVKDFDAARGSLDALLARHNGYAAGLNVGTPQGAARAIQASLRIPAPQLTSAVAELKALGRVESETQNGEEVTQQHADLLARLKNSRETEQRLQDVLRTRTGRVKDVLEVETEIARVRGEIEQMEAEQQTLEHRVSFATIDLKLAEEYKAQLSSPAPSVGMQLRNATVNGLRNASETLLGILLFFAESGPTLLLWLLILLFPARLIWKRYKRQLAMS